MSWVVLLSTTGDLHVKLQYNGLPLLLPQWFVQSNNAILKKISQKTSQHIYEIPLPATAMNSWMYLIKDIYKPQGRPPYSASILHLRYTSLQANRLLLEKFPMPSLSLLNKIQQGGVDPLRALKTLYKIGSFPYNCILMKWIYNIV